MTSHVEVSFGWFCEQNHVFAAVRFQEKERRLPQTVLAGGLTETASVLSGYHCMKAG